jgi:ribosome-associated heat shock protein Hsp15
MSGEAASAVQRIDQWLWFARIAKSRTLAQALIAGGKVRVNRNKIDKASTSVKPGDVLTLSLGGNVRSLEVLGIGRRRGPAPEAQRLYCELALVSSRAGSGVSSRAGSGVQTADCETVRLPPALRPDGAGRPTKRDRRRTDTLRGRG